MRVGLLRYLVCPACHGPLALSNATATGEVVEEGTLHCTGCGRRYPIRRRIPRCIVTDAVMASATSRTKRQYDFAWRHVGLREVNEGWEKDSTQYLLLVPEGLLGGAGRIGLEAGCGGGADLLRIGQRGAEVIGVDLSDGVESAHLATAHLPNVHVVQADIHRLPFAPGTFDFAYSLGVLHHLPDPSRGFAAVAELLKPGAPLVTYLYEDFSGRTALERGALAAVRAARRVTSRLPSSLLHGLCCLATPAVWASCSVPAHLLRRRAPRLAGRLPFRHTLRWPVLASDLYDRFAPPMEWRHSREDVQRLYGASGFERVETRRYRGWVSWGFKIARAPTAEAPRAGAAGRGPVARQ